MACFFELPHLWAVFWVMQKHKSAVVDIIAGRVLCVFTLLVKRMG
jgi:hypothetical protein